MSGGAAPSRRKRWEGAALRGGPAGFARSPPVGRGQCPGSLLLGAQTGGSLAKSTDPAVVRADGDPVARWSCGRWPGGPVARVGRWSEIRLSLGLENGLGGHAVQNASESAQIHPDPAKTVELRRISDQPRAEPSENDETQTHFGPAHPLPPGFTAEPARGAPEARRTGRRALPWFRVLRPALRVTCPPPEPEPTPVQDSGTSQPLRIGAARTSPHPRCHEPVRPDGRPGAGWVRVAPGSALACRRQVDEQQVQDDDRGGDEGSGRCEHGGVGVLAHDAAVAGQRDEGDDREGDAEGQGDL